ncbi:uncharacterized protein LOC129591442 [Paramacrobiotus metropolitanus]|uniref:uncharacterized protein LOC129591442 n=1 Tax=Paramacrobiotus metropolitanus TaxID=2943436 RepID=UPI002445A384|nr:uncharacterized protein LOC129591442 [Paramacrobiotus metropolitanus]
MSCQVLPEPIWARIFSYLDIFDISACAVVSKRWNETCDSLAVQRTVIVDLQKWAKHYNLEDPEISKNGARAVGLLEKRLTHATKRLILRWPTNHIQPKPVMVLPVTVTTETVYEHCIYDDPVVNAARCHLDCIIRHVSDILRESDASLPKVALEELTLQNITLYANMLWLDMPRLTAVHLEHVQLYCHFAPLWPAEPLPLVLGVRVPKQTISKNNLY